MTASTVQRIETPRLVLRQWQPADRAPFAALNADPVVMEHLLKPMSRVESDAFVDRIEALWDDKGFGLWAVEVPGVVNFAGFVGFMVPSFQANFTPCVEIGWRLAAAWWGNGYAPEAARAALDVAFGTLGMSDIVSFTTTTNRASQRVMEKLGLTHDPTEDFDHPVVPRGHRLERHVLYRMTAERWKQGPAATAG